MSEFNPVTRDYRREESWLTLVGVTAATLCLMAPQESQKISAQEFAWGILGGSAEEAVRSVCTRSSSLRLLFLEE